MSDQADEYAGDVTPAEAWEILKNEESAQLVDVRTEAEYEFEGVVDLSELAKEAHEIPWQNYPGMVANEDFLDELQELVPEKDTAILLLCRVGGRSIPAAKKLTKLGYTRAYNIQNGFDGELDEDQHRGTVNGWKAAGLPWEQY